MSGVWIESKKVRRVERENKGMQEETGTPGENLETMCSRGNGEQ